MSLEAHKGSLIYKSTDFALLCLKREDSFKVILNFFQARWWRRQHDALLDVAQPVRVGPADELLRQVLQLQDLRESHETGQSVFSPQPKLIVRKMVPSEVFVVKTADGDVNHHKDLLISYWHYCTTINASVNSKWSKHKRSYLPRNNPSVLVSCRIWSWRSCEHLALGVSRFGYRGDFQIFTSVPTVSRYLSRNTRKLSFGDGTSLRSGSQTRA